VDRVNLVTKIVKQKPLVREPEASMVECLRNERLAALASHLLLLAALLASLHLGTLLDRSLGAVRLTAVRALDLRGRESLGHDIPPCG